MRLARLCEVLEVLFQHGTTEGAMPGPPAAKPDVRGSHQPVRDVLADGLNAETSGARWREVDRYDELAAAGAIRASLRIRRSSSAVRYSIVTVR